MTNMEHFQNELEAAYRTLFLTEEYAAAAKRFTPGELAAKMVSGLWNGQANKDGEGIRRACKTCGIKHTYKTIIAYFEGAQS